MTTEAASSSAQALPAVKKQRPKLSELVKLLRPREVLFVESYMRHFNGARAIREAGFKASTPVSQSVYGNSLLKKPRIAAVITALQEANVSRIRVSRARIIDELANLAFANIEDYIKKTPDGDAYIDLSAMSREQAAALSELQVDDYLDGRGDGSREVKRVRLKMHDKERSLITLAKMLGYYQENTGNSVNVNASINIVFESVPLPKPSGETVDAEYRDLSSQDS